VVAALLMALGRRTLTPAMIHRSDRDSLYASHDFQKPSRDRGLVYSMSGTGNCSDNGVMESFFALLKGERVQRRHYETRAEATADIFQYIEIFCNLQRWHSFVGYMSPGHVEAGACI